MLKDLQIELAGERVCLLPERALYWPRASLLVAADLHWGKADAFRAAAMPIPGDIEEDLLRLDSALQRVRANRLIVLGDLLHARAGRAVGTIRRVSRWRNTHRDLAIALVRGNHDLHAGDPPASWSFDTLDVPLDIPPFTFAHDPATVSDHYVLAGHLHPAVRLSGRGGDAVRLPCFWFRPRVGILPAFGSFTGAATITPARADRVFVVTDSEVIQVAGRR